MYNYNLSPELIDRIADACNLIDSRTDYVRDRFGHDHWERYFRFSISLFMIDPEISKRTAPVVDQIDDVLSADQIKLIADVCDQLDETIAQYQHDYPYQTVSSLITNHDYSKTFKAIVSDYFSG